MQAILKGKHQRFCSWLQSVRDKQLARDSSLDDLENEMLQYYNLYLEKREEIRSIIFEYEKKQKGIKDRIKYQQRSQFALPDLKEILI